MEEPESPMKRTPRFLPAPLAALLIAAAPAQSPCSLVVDTHPGSTSSRLRNLTPAFGGSLLYCAQAPQGWGLYRSWGDGQTQLLVADPKADHEMVACATAQGPRVFFVADHPQYGPELHTTDGSPGGTSLVKDIRPGGLGCSFGDFVAFGDRLLFACYDYKIGTEPYVSDGTAAGTFLLKDVSPGRGHSNIREITAAGDYALFVASDGSTGVELYVTDGTSAGTGLLKDIHGQYSGTPKELTRFGDKVLFSADDGLHGRELWISDGTSAGTFLLKDIQANSGSSYPGPFVVLGDKAYFGADDGTHGRELWVTDGTPAGTQLLVDLRSGDSKIRYLTRCGDRLFFSATGLYGSGVAHVSDGTAAGTFSLVASYKNYVPSNPQDFTLASAAVYFRAAGNLWVSDGTPAGTRQPLPARSGGPGSPAQLLALGTGVCFRGDDAAAGWEMWFSDGSAAGTTRVCDLNPGTAGAYPDQVCLAGGQVFFAANTAATGLELFRMADPGACAQTLPGASLPHRPQLSIVDGHSPVLGSSLQLRADGPANHVGFLVLGLPTDTAPQPVPGLLSQGADWVGALTPLSVIALAGPAPRLQVPVTVPNQASLDGSRANLQAWWIAPGPLQFQVSNGLQLRLGLAAPR